MPQKFSKLHKRKLSLALKKYYSNSKNRKLASDRAKKAMSTPAARRKISEYVTDMWCRAEYRQRQSDSHVRAWKDPDKRALFSRGLDKIRTDKSVRLRISQSISRIKSTKEAREISSINSRRLWRNPQFRAKLASIRAKQSNGSKLEESIKLALNLPIGGVSKFGETWDAIWNKRQHVFLEVQGCYWHECNKCGYFDWEGAHRQRDRAKKRVAVKNGWKIMYVWEHEAKQLLENPILWRKLRKI